MFPVIVHLIKISGRYESVQMYTIKISGRYECDDMNQCKCIRQLLIKYCTGQINVTMCNYLFCFLRMYMWNGYWGVNK